MLLTKPKAKAEERNLRTSVRWHIAAINAFFLSIFLCSTNLAQAQTPADSVTYPMERKPLVAEHSVKVPALKNRDSGHVYRMHYVRSLGFTALAIAGNLYATPNLIKAKKELTDAELDALNPNIFNDLEKWALQQHISDREKINVFSDRILTVTLLSAGSLLADKAIRKDWARIIALYLETSGVTYTMYSYSPFGPLFQNKIRPVAYYKDQPLNVRKEGNARNSMYSGHVANAAATTFFMVKVYSDYHPELGGKKYLLYGLASLPPLLIGYLRVRSLYHFPSDCLIGYVIGAACGVIMPETHRIKNKNKNVQLGLSATSVGPGLGLTWKFANKNNKPLPYN